MRNMPFGLCVLCAKRMCVIYCCCQARRLLFGHAARTFVNSGCLHFIVTNNECRWNNNHRRFHCPFIWTYCFACARSWYKLMAINNLPPNPAMLLFSTFRKISRNSDSISMANPFIIMDSASDLIHPITIQLGRILCFAWNAILPFRKLRTAIAAAAEASTVPKPSRINCFTSCVNAYAMLPNMANKDTVKRGCQWLAPTYYE